MIELRDVKKYYKKEKAVDGISFTIPKGQIFGLIGPNGAGKSTTISMIATLLKPDSGDILFHGESIVSNPLCIRSKLGYVPQEISLYENLSGIDNLSFWANVYKLPKSKITSRITAVCEMTELSNEVLNKKVRTYSGGLKRRIHIAVALLHEPEFLILDEPTVGIDFIIRNQILQCMKLIRENGTSILYSSHYMEEVEQICDILCMMEKGKILFCEDKKKLLSSKEKINIETLYSGALTQKQ